MRKRQLLTYTTAAAATLSIVQTSHAGGTVEDWLCSQLTHVVNMKCIGSLDLHDLQGCADAVKDWEAICSVTVQDRERENNPNIPDKPQHQLGHFADAVHSFYGSMDISNIDGTGSHAVSASDVNGDGRADLITAHPDGNAYVYQGQADGTFSDVASPPSFGCALDISNNDGYGHYVIGAEDVTGDGKADFILHTGGTVYVYQGQADGTFTTRTSSFNGAMDIANLDGCGHYVVGATDITGDGKSDLITAHSNGNIYVHPGQSDGSFSPGIPSFNGQLHHVNFSGASGQYIVDAADVTGDGKADLVTSYSDGHTYVYPGQSDGTFGPYIKSLDGSLNIANFDGDGHYLLGASDVNGDGHADLVSAGTDGTVYIWPALMDGTFFDEALYDFDNSLNAANFSGYGHLIVDISDVNGNGRSDLISVHTDLHTSYVWQSL